MSDTSRIQSLETEVVPGENGPSVRFESILAASANPRRRAVLAALREESPLSVRDLAVQVVARTRNCSTDAVDDEAREQAMAGLHHCDLPRLAESDLVEIERDGGAVEVRPNDGVDTTTIETVEELAALDDGENVISLLSEARYRRTLNALAAADAPLSVASLAESLAVSDAGAADEPDESSIRSIRVSLHHIRLPKFDDAGLVEYDPSRARVESVDVPEPVTDLLST